MKRMHKSALLTEGGKPVNYCGVRCSLEVLGGKWKMLILSALITAPRRYADLRRALPDISEKMLIASLKELEEHQLVDKHVEYSIPVKVSYALSDYGQRVRPVLATLYEWGQAHIAQHSDVLFH